MKPASTTASRGIKRLAFLAMLVLVLRFVAVDWHQAAAHHAADEPCEVCLVVERGGTGLAAVLPAAPNLAPLPAPPVPATCVAAAGPAPAPLPRGPPSSSS